MKRTTWNPIGLILLAIGVVLGGTWVMAQRGTVMFPMMLTGPNTNINGWEAALLQIFMLVVFALSIAAIVALVLWLGRSAIGIVSSAEVAESPEDVLKMRFAKGEITREQFYEMRHVLIEQASA